MRLVFYYVADGAASPGESPLWDPSIPSKNKFVSKFAEEGYHSILKMLVEEKIVDEALVVIESCRGSGSFEHGPIKGITIPQTGSLILRPDDVVFVRGGFKSSFPFLERAKENGWVLFYAANTGRGSWPFWHVVFDDIGGQDKVVRDRVYLDFRKPTNTDIFYPTDVERDFDLMIGASRIHDKKGQWRGIEVAIAYEKLFFDKLKCVLPGPWARGVHTAKIKEKIRKHNLDVTITDYLSREELAEHMNRSRVFAHLGSGGQGDRGPLEAMSCGCPIIIGFPKYHAPWTHNHSFCYTGDPGDYNDIAKHIRFQRQHDRLYFRSKISDYAREQAGIKEVMLPRMEKLFDFIRQYPDPSKAPLNQLI